MTFLVKEHFITPSLALEGRSCMPCFRDGAGYRNIFGVVFCVTKGDWCAKMDRFATALNRILSE
jgi:hypothetical protein